jgi:opacity protein-like surface antigen
MKPTTVKRAAVAAIMTVWLGAAATARAQTTEPESRWSAEFGIGWDNGITGNINASGVGEINNQVVVITRNAYNDVYGAGLHLRFGGGYLFRPDTEARVTFTFQSLDADFITPMGDIGTSNLYAQYSDYQTFGIDFGLRRYATLRPKVRAYGEATLGLGFVDKTDVTLIAPGANLVNDPNDFYDQTAAWTFGINVGLDLASGRKFGYFGQLGLRYVSGMTEIDDLVATGLDDINNKSARWTLPFIVGIRYRF